MASPSSPRRRFPARRWCRAPAVIPRRRCWPCSRWPRPGCSPRRRRHRRRQVGRLRRRQGAVGSHALLENHGSVAAYGLFGHRHTPEMAQALGRDVTFMPHLVPLDRGMLSTMYARLAAGTTAAGCRRCSRRRTSGRRSCGSPATRCPKSSTWPGRTSATSAGAWTRLGTHHARLGHRQPGQGRGRSGGAELQPAHRRRRADGPAVSRRSSVLKLGGELLEEPARAEPGRRVRRPRRWGRWWSSTAADAEIDRALARGGHHQAAGRRAARHRRGDARRGGRGAGRHAQHPPRRDAQRRRRAGRRPDRRRRRRGAGGSGAAFTAADGRKVGLGRVGEPTATGRPPCCRAGCAGGFVPVVASVGASPAGELFNVNADTLAGNLAARLRRPAPGRGRGHRGGARRRGRHDGELDAAGARAMVKSGAATRRHGREAGGVPRGGASRGPRRADRRWPDAARLHGVAALEGKASGPSDTGAMTMTTTATTSSDIQALEARHVLQTYKRQPVVFVRGEGAGSTTSRDGATSTSCRASACRSLGHAPPRAVARGGRAGGRTAPHLEPVLPPAAGPGGGAPRGASRGCRARSSATAAPRRWRRP